jgi:3-(3-hydroxy-phenyl)propionate hydroxylase
VSVLIVGGGPVGMVSGLLLARFGIPSVVLEAQPARQLVGSRSICVQGDVLDILARVGVGTQVADVGVTWRHGRTYYRDQQVAEITFPEVGEAAFPPFVNTPQTVVELLLEQRVTEEPLVDLRYGHEVVGVDQDDDGVVVRVSTSDGERELRGTHCVAADGARSTVRELLGLPFPGLSYQDKFLITDIRAKLDFPVPERRFYFDPPWNPGRQVLLHPQPDDVWRIDWQVPADFDLAAERSGDGLDRRVRAVVGDVDYEVIWMSVYRFHQRLAPTMRVGRILLAGDSAHVMSPFGARGLNSGISDADNLAWKIAFDRQGLAGPGLLDSYDVERRAAAEENLRVTGETMRFLVPQDDAERARRLDVLERSGADPDARAEIDSGKLAEPFYYLDSPLTTPGYHRDLVRFPREPGRARPPIAGVLCPDARFDSGRLRELVGTRFVVLANSCHWMPRGGWEREVASAAHPLGSASIGEERAAELYRLRPGALLLVRPDGYIAAVLDEREVGDLADAVTAALRRATGHTAM